MQKKIGDSNFGGNRFFSYLIRLLMFNVSHNLAY
jgi:hypothetical protein